MEDIVIDVQVMMSASGTGDFANHAASRKLLDSLLPSKIFLVVDDQTLIVNQYKTKLGSGVFALKWLQLMATRGRVRPVTRATIAKSIKAKLDGVFSTECEDFHYYVRTTAASDSKTLVSHDDDYTKAACKLLKRHLDIRVLSAGDAGTEI